MEQHSFTLLWVDRSLLEEAAGAVAQAAGWSPSVPVFQHALLRAGKH